VIETPDATCGGVSALRHAAATQGLLFAAFTSFWTILSLHLQEPKFALGADVSGFFGVLGASGIIAAHRPHP